MDVHTQIIVAVIFQLGSGVNRTGIGGSYLTGSPHLRRGPILIGTDFDFIISLDGGRGIEVCPGNARRIDYDYAVR